MPFFVGVNPDTLQITDMYEYTEIDPGRSPDSLHFQIDPPLDNRALDVSKDENGNIQFTSNVELLNEFHTHEFKVLRSIRNRLLQESDWTQFPTSPLTPEKREEWSLYRQTLRDLPANTVIPSIPEWPAPPS